MKVLILNGPAESGKGSVAKYLKELFAFNIMQYSSIDYVKEVAEEKFRWDGNKDVAGRNLLAGIKQVMIGYNDLPTRKVAATIKEAILFDIDILVVDIREPDEIEKLVIHCKRTGILCHTCRVTNAKAEEEAEKNGLSLTGDRLYGKYDYDLIIGNNGTLEKLKTKVAYLFGSLYNQGNDHTIDSLKYMTEGKKDGTKKY